MDETTQPPFWEKPLDQLDRAEWEALCDGCGLCCLLKLEDDETEQVSYTTLACKLFDAGSCRCTNYALRKQHVPGCVVLDPQTLHTAMDWMPQTCAYRRRAEGKPLPDFHPLITGDAQSGARAGVWRLGPLRSEVGVAEEDMEDYVIKGIL